MTIPFLKGWGSSIKDAAEEVTPAIKSLVNQNWQQHEAIGRDLLDPKRRQEFANLYADNPNAFPEDVYGRKNIEQIRTISQDPAFALKRATERAGLTVAQDPKNTEDIGGVATGIGTRAQRATSQAGATVATNEAAMSDQLRAAYKLLPPDVQAKWDKNAAMRKYLGKTEDEQAMYDIALQTAKDAQAAGVAADSWVKANSKKYGNTVAMAQGILDGSIPPEIQAGLLADPKYAGGIKVQLDKLEADARMKAAEASQLRSIAAQGAMLDQRQKFALEQAEKAEATARAVAGRKMQMSIATKLSAIITKGHSEDELKNSIMPGLQEELNQYAALNGTAPATLSVINPWFGPPYIAFQSGKDGKLKPINSLNFNEAGAAPASSEEGTPKTLDEQFLERYLGSSLADQNKYYERADSTLKAKIDKWMQEGRIPNLEQPKE